MKEKLLIGLIWLALLIGFIIYFCFAFYQGYNEKERECREAYNAFSNPNEFCLLWTQENGMHGFQYKNKQYPLMTTRTIKEIINSQIWFDKKELLEAE